MTTKPLLDEKKTIDYKSRSLLDSIEEIRELEDDFDVEKWLSGEEIRSAEGELLSHAVTTKTAFQYLTSRREEYFEEAGEDIFSYIENSLLENIEEVRPYHVQIFEEIRRCYDE